MADDAPEGAGGAPADISCDHLCGVAFDSVAVGVLVADASGRVLAANPVAHRVLGGQSGAPDARGLAAGHVLVDGAGRPLPEFPSTLALRVGAAVEAMLVGLRAPDGAVRWFSTTAAPLGGDSREAAVVTLVDVTEYEHENHRVRRREAVLHALADASGDLVREGPSDAAVGAAVDRLAAAAGALRGRQVAVDDAPAVGPIAARCARIGETLVLAPGEVEDGAWNALAGGAAGSLAVALVSAGGAVHSVLVLVGEPCRAWTDTERQALGALAGTLGAALDRREAAARLRASEERYRLLAENATDAVFRLAPDGTLLYASPSYERLLGWHVEQRLGRSGFELIHPDDRGRVVREFGRMLQTDGAVVGEGRIRHADGRWLWCEVTVRAIRDSDGRVGEAQASLRIIEDRMRARLALQESEQLHRTLVESASVGIMVLDRDGLVASVNRAGERILGISAAAVTGRPLSAHAAHAVNADMRPIPEPEWGPLVTSRTGRALSEVVGLTRMDGRLVWIESSVAPLPSPHGGGPPFGVVMVFADVSGRRATEERLLSREAILEAGADASSRLMREGPTPAVLEDCLRLLGEAMEAAHVTFFPLEGGVSGAPATGLRHDWSRSAGGPSLPGRALLGALGGWRGPLEQGREVSGWVGDLPDPLGEFLRAQGASALAVAPVMVGRGTWGLLIAADDRRRSAWAAPVIGGMRAFADALGAAFERRASLAALEESEEMYRQMAEQSQDIIFRTGADGLLEYASPVLERVLGYAPAEIVGRDVFALVHPDDAGPARDAYLRALSALEPAMAVFRLRHADGRWVWLEVVGAPIRDRAGATVAMQNAARDVTARVQAEQALRNSEQRFRTVVESLAEGLLVTGPDGRIAGANAAAERILGVGREELVGRLPDETPWVALDDSGQPVGRADLPGEVSRTEGVAREGLVRLRRRDRRTIWAEFHAEPVADAGGGPQASVTTFSDVTERVEGEERLREIRESFQALAESAPDAVIRLDRDLLVDFANQSWADSHGISREEAVGRRLPVDAPPGSPARVVADAARAVFATGEPARFDLRAPGPRGTRWLQVQAVPEHDAHGATSHVLLVSADVTQLRRAEQEQAALRRIATAVAALRPPADVFALVADEVLQLLDADAAGVSRVDGDNLVVEGTAGSPAPPVGTRVPMSALGSAGRAGRGEVVVNARYELSETELGRPPGDTPPTGCFVAVPIRAGDAVWGTLNVGSLRQDHFVEEDARRLEGVAELVAMAVQNAADRERLERLAGGSGAHA